MCINNANIKYLPGTPQSPQSLKRFSISSSRMSPFFCIYLMVPSVNQVKVSTFLCSEIILNKYIDLSYFATKTILIAIQQS